MGTRAALRAAFRSVPADEGAVRRAVGTLVDEAKKLGWPVEQVIVAIKQVAASSDMGFDEGRRPSTAVTSQAHVVVRRAITWCVQHYYWTA